MTKARCIAILGTASDVGKSVAVAALCRIFSDLGVAVAPFKAQNMSNNSFVTLEGLEMGRAQVAQAEAARLEAVVDMNPVLLKPNGESSSQVILHGRPRGTCKAEDYYRQSEYLFREALLSLERLRRSYRLIILEGAGSCAEVNLASRDIVNFRMAEAADAPVVLTADISRGGVFAQLLGTLRVVSAQNRERVAGFLVNRFRGEMALFRDGVRYLEEHGRPVLGVIPHCDGIDIDPEDSQSLDPLTDPPMGPRPGKTAVAVLRLPRISNFTDFSPLRRDPGVDLHYLSRPRSLEGYRLVLLPGSKNVRADREWLGQSGWEKELRAYAKKGGPIGGICGGFQILGRVIRDPSGVEGTPGETEGLGLLEVETTLTGDKELSRVRGVWEALGQPVAGYEIHMGRTRRLAGAAVIRKSDDGGGDGAYSRDGRIWGVYLHGLFDHPAFRGAFLASLDPDYRPGRDNEASTTFKDRQYDLLADHFRRHLDFDRLLAATGLKELLHG